VRIIQNTQINCVDRMQSSVRASQETHYVSFTKPNRLILFREIIAVYCKNHMEHMSTLCVKKIKSLFLLNKWNVHFPLCFLRLNVDIFTTIIKAMCLSYFHPHSSPAKDTLTGRGKRKKGATFETPPGPHIKPPFLLPSAHE
jgi:hypothetical protein